jgi:hypothetical protein
VKAPRKFRLNCWMSEERHTRKDFEEISVYDFSSDDFAPDLDVGEEIGVIELTPEVSEVLNKAGIL